MITTRSLSLLLLTLWLSPTLTAQGLVPAEFGAQIVLPDGWTTLPLPTDEAGRNNALFRLSATDSAGQSFSMHIFRAPEWWVISQIETQERIAGMVSGSGMTLTGREVGEIGGEEALHYRGTLQVDSSNARVAGSFTFANGYGYSLFYVTLSKIDPMEHPHLSEIAASFRFTREPRSHYNPDTLAPVEVNLPTHNFSMTMPGSWQQIPVDTTDGPYLILQTADLMRSRALYVEKITSFPAMGPDDSTLVAEMQKRMTSSGFTYRKHETIDFRGKAALSMHAEIPGEARAQLLVVPLEGVAWTIMVILQGDALPSAGSEVINDVVVRQVLESMVME